MHANHAIVVGDRDRVIAVGGVDLDRVDCAVGSVVWSCSQVDVDLVDVGSGEVVDRDGVDAAPSVDVERLGAVHVHDNSADVAGQSHPRAVGRDVDFLGDFGAVEHERVVAGLTIDRVAAVTRVPDERVVTRTHGGHVVAAPAIDEVVARAADDPVVAVTAVEREVDPAGGDRRRVDGVVAGAAIDDELISCFDASDRQPLRQPVDHQGPAAVDETDGVVAIGAVDGHGVGLAITAVATERGAEVDRHLRDTGAGQITDRDGVGAATSVDHEILGGADIEKERSGADAVEAHARAVGEDGELFGPVAAVDFGGVGAVPALHEVAVVARIPDHAVVAGLAEHLVVAGAAGKRIVAVAAEQLVVAALAQQDIVARSTQQLIVALASRDGVVAGAAIKGEADDSGRQGRRTDGVVAGTRSDGQHIVGTFRTIDAHQLWQPGDRNRSSRTRDGDVVVAAGAVDGHAIGRAVALVASRRRRQVDVDLVDAGPGEIADRDDVGAAQSGELDVLDAIEVHGHGADVAEQPRPRAIGRDANILGNVGAVERERIGACAAFHHIAAIARIPDERVVAGAELRHVVASPPISVSLPSPPVMVSLPAPPSTVSWMRVARPLLAMKVSSPPFMLSTRFSVVPMSRENGPGVVRSKRTRVPLGVIVNVSAPLPPLTSAVSVPSPPSIRSLSSPGFQIMRSLPAWPNIWSSPSPPVSVSSPEPPNRKSLPPLPSRVSLPVPPNS